MWGADTLNTEPSAVAPDATSYFRNKDYARSFSSSL